MLKPRAIHPGDRLAVVAPASHFDREEFEQGLAEIRRLGFEPAYEDSVFARREYLAGPAELRASAIRAAWRDPSIAGLVAVRGGYGSAQVLPLLLRDHPRTPGYTKQGGCRRLVRRYLAEREDGLILMLRFFSVSSIDRSTEMLFGR